MASSATVTAAPAPTAKKEEHPRRTTRKESSDSDSNTVSSCSSTTIALSHLIKDALLSGKDYPGVFSPVANKDHLEALQLAQEEQDCYETEDWDNVDVYDDVPRKILTADLMGEDIRPLERHQIYNSIFGSVPEDTRLEQVEREIWKLPLETKAALLRALKKNPLLLVVSSHTKLLFDTHTNLSPRQAAQRIALYWKRREELFGPQQVLLQGDLPDASLDDYRRFYARSELVVADEEADEVERALAEEFLQAVHTTTLELLTQTIVTNTNTTSDSGDRETWNARLKILEQHRLIVRACAMSDRDLVLKWQVAGSTQFKMLFVKCEQFCAVRAAGRMMKYWSKKMELFAPCDDLNKDISLGSPQMTECYDVLKRGFLRILPTLDAHGRLVVVFSLKECTQVLEEWKHEDIREEGEKRVMKSIWYVLHAAALHPHCQRNGLVFLANMRDCANTELLRRFQLRAACRDILLRCLPLQVQSFHFFFPPSKTWWHSMIYAVFKHAEPLYKKHAVIHTGANLSQAQELQELQELYGLAPSILPKELGGEVSMDSYQEWLEERKAQGL